MVVNVGAVAYSARERFWLAVLALVGFGGLNGTFVWAMLVHPEMALSAYQNPVSAAFMVEALILVGVLASSPLEAQHGQLGLVRASLSGRWNCILAPGSSSLDRATLQQDGVAPHCQKR